MQCPSCNSDNVQKLSILYETGTNDIQTRSVTTGSGIGLGSGGGFGGGFGSAHTSTTGQSQSKLAKKASPPNKKSYAIALAIVLGIIVFAASSKALFLFLAVALIAGGGYFVYKAYQYNNTVWPELYAAWQKSWHCNKCGDIYAQQAA